MRVVLFAAVLFGSVVAGRPTAAVRADWLSFARGGHAELPATVRGPAVEVATPDGPRQFPLRAFRSIVPGERLDEEWAARLGAAYEDESAAGRFAAGWWALEHGLTPEAIAAIRSARSAAGAGDHAPLVRSGRMLDRLEAPVAAADLGSIRSRLGGAGWAELQGRRVTLLHQGEPAAARERLDVLDRVVATFYLSLAAQGVELAVPDRRLVSVWFGRQADYADFLRRIDAGPFADTQGYYHPNLAVVFAHDTRTGPEQFRARQALDRRRGLAGPDTDERVDLDRMQLLLDLRWRSVDLGIAAHETVHQLVAASGLAPRFDDFPNWLHEGFSAQFEVVRGGRWAGFGRVNDHRLPDYRTISPRSELAPLLRDDGLTHGYNRDRYAEAWGLVYFLRKTRPDQFVAFLDQLRTPRPAGQPSPAPAAFAAAFGADLGALGAEWRAFLRDQQVPFEAPARRATVAKSR